MILQVTPSATFVIKTSNRGLLLSLSCIDSNRRNCRGTNAEKAEKKNREIL